MFSTLMVSALTAAPASAMAHPAEGMFDACDLSARLTTCEQRLNAMQAGGITVVLQNLPNANVTLSEIQQYADYANGLGMSVMWELNEPTLWTESASDTSLPGDLNAFSSACNCNTIGGLTTYIVQWLAALPNTYGFYAADDSSITIAMRNQLTQYVARVRAADPGHMVMIGINNGDGTMFASTGATLGAEIYPVTNTSMMPANTGDNAQVWNWEAGWIGAVQHSDNVQHVASAFILQAFDWGDNIIDGEMVGACTSTMNQQTCYQQLQYPSSAAQIQMRNEVLQNSSASLILWYNFAETYGQSGNDTFNTYPTGGTATDRWSGLQAAIKAPYPLTAQQRAAARIKAIRLARARAARIARARAARARAARLARERAARLRHRR